MRNHGKPQQPVAYKWHPKTIPLPKPLNSDRSGGVAKPVHVKLPSQIALFLVKFHSKYTGRTDLRERRRNGFAVTAFDCVVFPNAIQPWFEARHGLDMQKSY